MIKNVIFDLGGVLIRFQPKEAIHQLGLSKEKEDALYSAIFLDSLWLEVDKGVYQGVSETLDLYLEKYPSLQKEIKMFFTLDGKICLKFWMKADSFYWI